MVGTAQRSVDFPHVSRIGRGIATHGLAYAAFAAHLDPAEWYKLDDIGIDLESLGPEMLQPYISVDLDAFARDLAYDLIVAEADDGGVYVFERE